MATAVDTMKCACSDCVCVVETDAGVERGNRLYCSESCADHHKDNSGCGHAGCACHG